MPRSGSKSGLTRRELLRRGGLGSFAFCVAGAVQMLTPAAARAAGARLEFLTAEELDLVETLGEALVPGARAAGVGHFVDRMLSVPDAQCLLMIRYLDVSPPYGELYRDALARVRRLAPAHRAGALPADIAGRLMRDDAGDWPHLPAPLFYFALRGDAMDVVYGTPAGAARLGLPYMAHIEPPALP